LKKAGENALIAPRFRMRVTVLATDNNVETGPRTGQNKETLTFIVVPYEELLADMHKDEETLAYKVQELVDKMHDVKSGIEKVVERMPRVRGAPEFRASASRMFDLIAEVEKGSDVARELLSEYTRLLKESQTNRLPAKFIEDKEKLCARLDDAIRGHFERAREAHTAFHTTLEASLVPDLAIVEASRMRQEELIRQLELIQESVGSVIEITRLAKQLIEVLEASAIVKTLLQQMREDKEDEVLESLVTLTPKADAVVLITGERKVVTVDLGRDANSRGRLLLKPVAPPGTDLNVPKVVVAPRDSKQAQVEIVAGYKTGTFSVPVAITTPGGEAMKLSDDKPFVITVTVK
jgi:hypothetical protein